MFAVRLSAVAAAAIATGGLAGLAGAAAPAPEVPRVIERHRLEVAPSPVRESPLWRAPRKVVLLQFGSGAWAGQAELMRAAAPGVEFVPVTNRAAALAAVPDADVIDRRALEGDGAHPGGPHHLHAHPLRAAGRQARR